MHERRGTVSRAYSFAFRAVSEEIGIADARTGFPERRARRPAGAYAAASPARDRYRGVGGPRNFIEAVSKPPAAVPRQLPAHLFIYLFGGRRTFHPEQQAVWNSRYEIAFLGQ